MTSNRMANCLIIFGIQKLK